MIPYFQPPSINLGPLHIQVFGILVAVGVLMASRVMTREAARRGLSPQPLADFAFWGVGTGIVTGHLVHLFFYHPEELERGPLQILKVWDGLSSMGGLLGGILAAVVFFRVRRLSFRAYSDALALAVSLGWAIARVGCFAVHDHPGVRTTFPLAVDFPVNPYGGPRHDLGLYDALVLFGLYFLLRTLERRGLLRERLLALLALLYGASRFLLDFLRATDLSYVDARYLGLTPAQFVCLGLMAWGLYDLLRRPRPQQAAAAAPAAR